MAERVTFEKDDLPKRYEEILDQNPLLGRLQGELRGKGFTDMEIRTSQLLVACHSNASLTQRVKELEQVVDSMIEGSKA